MRIVAISDTHGLHWSFTNAIPQCDLLIHAGDFMSQGTAAQELVDFNRWLGELDAQRIVVTPGNHDLICEADPALARRLISSATVLIDESTRFQGLRIWGSPITPRFCDWAFNRSRGEEIRVHWNKIPNQTDILITHGPPKSVLDDYQGTG